MLPVLTPAEMAACDDAVIAGGTTRGALVERAARAVADTVVAHLGGVYGRRVVVVAGKGNNGNDGRVAARVLRARGVGVDVFDLGSEFDADGFVRALGRADLLVDAMYGTGLRGPLTGDAAVVAHEAARVPMVLAVDIPSGVDGLTGAVHGPAIAADATVTFAARKVGHLLEPGRTLAGDVLVADIGVPPDAAAPVGVHALEAGDVAAAVPERHPLDHKWTAAVMVVAGSDGMVGAALLVGRGAYRAGAGMVVCGLPGRDTARRASGSEVVTTALPVTPLGALADDAADTVLEGLARFGALVVGPGLGRADATASAVCRLVAEAPVPVVVDADALHALGRDAAPLRVRAAAGHPPAILTPHDGEYAALTGRSVGEDRLAAARALAAERQAVVLLKGPGTIVANPGGDAFVTPTGGSTLASAGTGDVLAGVLGALCARGLEPLEAASVGAWWHGATGDAAPSGTLAGGIADALPRTLDGVRSAAGGS